MDSEKENGRRDLCLCLRLCRRSARGRRRLDGRVLWGRNLRGGLGKRFRSFGEGTGGGILGGWPAGRVLAVVPSDARRAMPSFMESWAFRAG